MADTFDYAEAAADALELLTEFGQVGAIRRTDVVGGYPTQPTGGISTDTDYAATLVVLPIEARDVDGTTIKATDVRIYVASSVSITPTTTDEVIDAAEVATADAGKVYTILRCNAINPAGTVVLYDIIGRD